MKFKQEKDVVIINIIGYTFIGFMALFCLTPFVMLVTNSFNAEAMVIKYGYSLWPRKFSTLSYQMIFFNWERIARAYGVTMFVTTVGTTLSLFFSSMFAYVISRREFKYRNAFAFYIYFTTLFSGGLVASYIINVNFLKLKDTIAVLILLHMFSVFNILILRNFITSSVPESLPESARLDGGSEFAIFIRVVLPLLKPALATIGLFTALTYWNDWNHSMLYINDHKKYALQYVLYQILQNIKDMSLTEAMQNMTAVELPSETFKLAMAVVVTGPVIIFYPMVQKYFVQGITIGAVKG